MNNIDKKQQGVALISIMIIVAIMSSGIAFLLQKQEKLFSSTKLNLEQNQAINYFYSIQSWAKSELLKDKNNKYDAKDEDWAMDIPPIPVPGGYIEGRLTDQSGKLNINNIISIKKNYAKLNSDPNFNLCFNRLTNNLGMGRIDDILIDHINLQEEKKLFIHISDLKNVLGITTKKYQKLKPFIYALQDIEGININTASKELLICLHTRFTEYEAKEIIENRPFKTISEFKSLLQNSFSIDENEYNQYFLKQITIDTEYFELNTNIKIGNTHLQARSILKRKAGKISTYFRSFNYKL